MFGTHNAATSSRSNRISGHDRLLHGGDELMKNFFGKDVDKMTPIELILYNIYKEMLRLKSVIEVKNPLSNIPLDLAMEKKLDVIYAIYHEYQAKTLHDAVFKPYVIEIIPISMKIVTKTSNINEDTTIINVQEENNDEIIPQSDIKEEDADVVSVANPKKHPDSVKLYTTYDCEGDGDIDRNDFNCEYKINGKLVELTETEVEESLEKMKNLTQNRIYEIFHNQNYVDESFGRIAVFWYIFIMLTVLTSIMGSICSTLPQWRVTGQHNKNEEIQMVTMAIFTFEYVVTIFMVRNKCIYVLSFQNVIDILALIPFYIWIGLWLASGEKWRTIEIVGSIVQILRILRIFKLRSLSNPYVQLMFQSVKEFILGIGPAIAIIVAIVCLFLGSVMYALENWHPKSPFTDIFIGMWFVLVTMSTVGYGDMSPITWSGYFGGIITIVGGVVVFSMILQVIGQYYSDLLDKHNDEIILIKQILYSLVHENADKFRSVLRNESGEKCYKKIEYALRYEKHNLL